MTRVRLNGQNGNPPATGRSTNFTVRKRGWSSSGG